ncbi:MAG: haloacid dehalogenase type II [Candidatus Dormibacteraceae bacterium]
MRNNDPVVTPLEETVRALAFDVFGTVVDWRTGIADAAAEFGLPGDEFADAWRGRYAPSMDAVRSGRLPWMNLDALHRRSLDELLPAFGASGLSEDARQRLVLAWHRLPPWPDAVAGLARLRKRYILTPLSNGGFALLTDLARFGGLPFDCIISAELFRHYKPDPQVYLMAAALLGLDPAEVMMVAAHRTDLRAAQAVGLKAAFVERRDEFGDTAGDLLPDLDSEFAATDFADLARLLGC